MRKINAILTIIAFAIFVLHMTAGGLLMMHVIPYMPVLQLTLSWSLITAASAHVIVSVKLTFDSLIAMKKSGVSYMKENMMFWARRASGFAVMAFMVLHVLIFMFEKGEPGTFSNIDLLCSILLSASVLIHVVTNIRPLITGLGKSGRGKGAKVAIFIASLLVLVSAAAFVVYYIITSV